MSADNWARCPKCADETRAEIAGAFAAADGAYGKVSVAEYTSMVERAKQMAAEAEGDMNRTFREDYEFYGAESGMVHGTYRGSCKVCGLSVKMDHYQEFYPEVKS